MAETELHILANPMSGSVPSDAETVIAKLADQLDARFHIHISQPERLVSDVKSLSQDKKVLAVWGGDGTLSCALSHCHEASSILPLPGGTMNLLHKHAHHADLTTETILTAYSDGELMVRDIPTGTINGHTFYVGVICGHLAELASVREALREGKPLSALECLFTSNSFDLSSKLSATARITGASADEDISKIVALAAFLRPDQDHPLEVGTLNPETLFEMTTTTLEALFDGWENAASIDNFVARHVDVRSTGETIPVTIDGELHELPAPLRIQREKSAKAKVLAWPSR